MRKNGFVLGSLPDETFGGVITGLSANEVETFAIDNDVQAIPSLSGGQVAQGMIVGSQYFDFPINVVIGRAYLLQYSDNLRDWHDIEFIVAARGRVAISDFMEQRQNRRFYRILDNTHAIPPPANDNFANATILTGPSVLARGYNFNATSEPGEPDHGSGFEPDNDKSVWFRWTSPVTATVSVTTLNFLNVKIYTGTALGNLVATPSSFSIDAASGTTYHITVDGDDFLPEPPSGFELGISQAPVVTLDTPTSGQAFTEPATIPISVSASDPDGIIISVKITAFYNAPGGGFVTQEIEPLTEPPYSATLTNVGAGSPFIQVVATDNTGVTKFSSVSVNVPPP